MGISEALVPSGDEGEGDLAYRTWEEKSRAESFTDVLIEVAKEWFEIWPTEAESFGNEYKKVLRDQIANPSSSHPSTIPKSSILSKSPTNGLTQRRKPPTEKRPPPKAR